jgi:putative ABC transport system substrate-binding protein
MDRRTFIGSIASAVVATPLGALAQQQGKVWRIGFLSQSSASLSSLYTDAFLKGMRDLGYIEGKNLIVEWRFGDGKFERLPSLAADLVQLRVDVIVATPSPAIAAAQKATTTIPIVMASAGDPLGSGFVKSLARPQGNITGLSVMGSDTGAKQLELLRSVVPKLSRVAVLTPTAADSPTSRSVRAAAQKAGVDSLVVEASTSQEIEGAFSTLVRAKADAVIVSSPSTFAPQHRQIAELALKHRMPSMFQDRLQAENGGLMSYGPKFAENYLRAATYVDKILKGAKPGDLPVEQPVSFELVVNLRTAKALGVTIPQTILVRADEVIQ